MVAWWSVWTNVCRTYSANGVIVFVLHMSMTHNHNIVVLIVTRGYFAQLCTVNTLTSSYEVILKYFRYCYACVVRMLRLSLSISMR